MMIMASSYIPPPRAMSSSSLPQWAAALSTVAMTMHVAIANPKSRPYVAYRTSPFDMGTTNDGPPPPMRVLMDGIEVASDLGTSSSGSKIVIRKNDVNRRRGRANDVGKTGNRFDVDDGGGGGDGDGDPRCPLSFRLGSCHGAHFGGGSSSHAPPVIYPLHPDYDAGSGRQILTTSDWEMLEMWTPGNAVGVRDYRPGGGGGGAGGNVGGYSAERLKEDEQFPLLFEGSSFYHSSPVVHDVSGDGIADAILGDYDGSIHVVGLDFEISRGGSGSGSGNGRRTRAYRRIVVPRLYVRKSWYEVAINRTRVGIGTNASNATANTTMTNNDNSNNASSSSSNSVDRWEEFEPYHTYFATSGDERWRGEGDAIALRGVSGNLLNMDVDSARGLADRRREGSGNRRGGGGGGGGEVGIVEGGAGDVEHRRLQEKDADADKDEHEIVGEGDAGDVPDGGGGFGAGGDTGRDNERGVVGVDSGANQDQDEDGGDAGGEKNPIQEVGTVGRVGDARDAIDEGMDNIGVDADKGGAPKINFLDDYASSEEGLFDDAIGAPPDGTAGEFSEFSVDDVYSSHGERGVEDYDSEVIHHTADDYYGRDGTDDYYYRRYGERPEPPEGWDSHKQWQTAKDKYYHDSNYVRVPPHLLSTCSFVEMQRATYTYSTKPEDKVDEIILCAVSYYFDEDEKSFGKHANANGGDETEELRGRYVASAVLAYNLRWNYWSTQEVLDLSTDWSAPLGDIVEGGTAPIHSDAHNGMGAWALATPIVIKLDGSDRNHIVVGTSMGLVYALDTHLGSKSGWPVQMRHPVEQKIVVEDVVGNTNLEVFVVDAGGDLASLNSDGAVLWARSLLKDGETASTEGVVRVVRGTSPMSLGDVDGTGRLAIVLLARVATADRQHAHRPDKHDAVEYRLYAIDCITGDDLPRFPIALGEGSHISRTSPIPQPLLVDLHENQQHWLDSIRGLSDESIESIRAINVEASRHDAPLPRPHGGSGRGLHVVQPVGSLLHIIEGSTSCEQMIDVGDSIPSMVQADDVHGTGGLDLVVTTSQGEILTLESDVVPYHPLNVWSAGVARSPGSPNAQAHGFSSTQGIFVHPISRQFRDILGVYVPITFEIFDRRPNVKNEENRRVYQVEVRAGMSAKRTVYERTYNATGVYTERIQIPYGPGYYAFSVRMTTTHGIVYEDTFHVGWNVNYMGGLWLMVCLPLLLASVPILMFKRKPNWEEDEDFGRGNRGLGILGSTVQ